MCLTVGYVFIISLISCLSDSLHLNIHFQCKTYELAVIRGKKTFMICFSDRIHDLMVFKHKHHSIVLINQTDAAESGITLIYIHGTSKQMRRFCGGYLKTKSVRETERQKKNCHSFRSEGAIFKFNTSLSAAWPNLFPTHWHRYVPAYSNRPSSKRHCNCWWESDIVLFGVRWSLKLEIHPELQKWTVL